MEKIIKEKLDEEKVINGKHLTNFTIRMTGKWAKEDLPEGFSIGKDGKPYKKVVGGKVVS